LEAWDQSLRPKARTRTSALNGAADLPTAPAYMLDPGHPSPGRSTLLRSPFAVMRGAGILTGFPSTTPLRPRLRDRLTLRGIAWRRKPWVFGEQDSHLLLATHVSILTSDTSTAPLGSASQAYGTLSYHSNLPEKIRIRSFGTDLEPR